MLVVSSPNLVILVVLFENMPAAPQGSFVGYYPAPVVAEVLEPVYKLWVTRTSSWSCILSNGILKGGEQDGVWRKGRGKVAFLLP